MQSEQWDARYAQSESVWTREPNQFVLEYLEALPAGTMADIAGGEGRNALWFASRGWRAENIDFSEVAVNRSLEWAHQQGLAATFTATVADATAKGISQTAPLDLVVMAYLQVPAVSLSQAITHAVEQIRSGGVFFGVWHARENLEHGFGGPPSADVLPTQDELRAAATSAGLTVEKLELRDRLVSVDGETHTAIDVVLIGKLSRDEHN